MSGEQKSFKERLKEYEGVLNEYRSRVGIAHIMYNNEVESILMLNKDELRGMSHEDCGENCFILSQYATYIQMEYNRHCARVKWAEDHLSKLIAKYGAKYGDKYTKWELLKSRIIVDDSSAKVLGEIITHASGRMIELNEMANSVRNMAKHLGDLQVTKRYKK